MTLTITKL